MSGALSPEQLPKGYTMRSTFDPGIVAGSYFASLAGCILTIEILHRRGTALGNLRSWGESMACATSMGLVGIWCMHFIGNRAIIIGDGNPRVQLVYDSGYTVLSVILPILGLTIAFSAAEFVSKHPFMQWTALIITGIIAGLSIAGMHYVGNFGVVNYSLIYNPRFLAASFIIAVGDCLVVLILFYRLREKWISAWWKRVLCALALAGGVSAMHFSASTSCVYEFRRVNTDADITSRDNQVIIAGVLCAAAALMVLAVLLITQHRQRKMRSRSQKVMLACAMFDPSGRILVTTDGVLPSREITDKYNSRTFDEDFNKSHPVFQWIFRVTFNWAGVSEYIPRMKRHLAAQKQEASAEELRPLSEQSSAMYDAETYSNYNILFKERFCTAAQSLAASMQLPVESLGVLYDNIVETGTLKDERESCRFIHGEKSDMADVEAALRLSLFGKGQLLFITKELTPSQADQLLNSGFKFASVQQVGRNIAHSMQIPLERLEKHINKIKRYAESLYSMDKPGTYLAFFAMIAKPHGQGFDIAVRKDFQDQIPDQPLIAGKPLQWQALFLEKLDGFLVKQCIEFCDDRTGKYSNRPPHEQQFAVMMKQAIVTLTQQFPPEWRNQARFWAKQLEAHYSHPLRTPSDITTLYAFTVIGDMHASIEASQSVSRIPRTFFEARHRCYAGSPDHLVMAQDIHAVFGPILSKKIPQTGKHNTNRKKVSGALNTGGSLAKPRKTAAVGPTPSSRGSSVDHTDDSSSMHELVDRPSQQYIASNGSRQSMRNNWGGILVNSETVVKTDSKNDFSTEAQEEKPIPMGTTFAVSTLKPETTFVDQLVTITKERFLPATKNGL